MVNPTSNMISVTSMFQADSPSSTTHTLCHQQSCTTPTRRTPPTTSKSTSTLLSLSAQSPSSSSIDSRTANSSSSSFISTSATLISAPNSPTRSSVITTTPSKSVSTVSRTLSSLTVTSTTTSTPSQMLNSKIPIIVGVCISTPFILTLAIFFIVWYSRRRQLVKTEKARPTFLAITNPQINLTADEAPYEQLSSSSHNVNRFFPRLLEKRLRVQRGRQTYFNSRTRDINSPVEPFRRVTKQPSRRGAHTVPLERPADMVQQISALHEQVRQLRGHLDCLRTRQEHADGIQGLPGHEEPPAYV